MDTAATHKHIINASTCGAVLTENKLETGRMPLMQPGLKHGIWEGKRSNEVVGPVPLGGDTERRGSTWAPRSSLTSV